MALERLDEAWTEILNKLKGFSFSEAVFGEDEMQIPFEQLAVYFVFRHLSGAICDGNYAGRVHFALMSCYFIGALWAQDKEKNGTIEAEQLVDFARMYSAEVEYSEENLASMIQMI